MNYNKLVFHENSWPNAFGKTITIDFAMNEIIVDSMIEGVKWCRIGSRERSTIEAKLNTGRPDEWAENYYECPPRRYAATRFIITEGEPMENTAGFMPKHSWGYFSEAKLMPSPIAERLTVVIRLRIFSATRGRKPAVRKICSAICVVRCSG